jgi:hypothetical protein
VHPAATAPFANLLGAAGGHRVPSPTFCTPASGHRAPSWPPASTEGGHGPDSTSCVLPRASCAPSPTSCSSPSSRMRHHGHLYGPPPSPFLSGASPNALMAPCITGAWTPAPHRAAPAGSSRRQAPAPSVPPSPIQFHSSRGGLPGAPLQDGHS